MAPEIHLKQPYSGPAVDLFACAIILFIMLSGTPPFAQAEPKDPHYKLLCINRHDTFWSAHSRGKPAGFYSADFKHLMNSMLALDPSQRLSLAEVKAHPWYNGAIVDMKIIQKEFSDRKKRVDEELRKQKEAKEKQKEQDRLAQQNTYSNAFTGVKPFKGRSLESEMNEQISKANYKESYYIDSPRVCKQHENNGTFKPHTETILVIQPDILFKYLVNLAQNVFNELTVIKDSYKIKGRYVGDVHRFDVTIELLKVDEQTTCIQFNKKSGEVFEFYKMIDVNFKIPIGNLLNKVATETKPIEQATTSTIVV
jgi:serine/threonine protein kinase